jgi:hypothetical protein
MGGRLADLTSNTDTTLPAMGTGEFRFLTNTGASPINVSPPTGLAFKGLAVGIALALPAGKALQVTCIGTGYIHAKY